MIQEDGRVQAGSALKFVADLMIERERLKLEWIQDFQDRFMSEM